MKENKTQLKKIMSDAHAIAHHLLTNVQPIFEQLSVCPLVNSLQFIHWS